MTSETRWVPMKTYDLRSVLEAAALGGLAIGASSDAIETELGPPPSPPGRLGRKSKIWSWDYGNVSVLVLQKKVIGIYVDCEGPRVQVVRVGEFASWRTLEWKAYAAQQGWSCQSAGAILNLYGNGIGVSLGPAGKVHTVSVTEAPSGSKE